MEKTSAVPPLFPHLPKRLEGLEDLAENLWWSWNPGARMLFKTLDRKAWKESGHNPDKMLREFPSEGLEKACANPDYLRMYDEVMAEFYDYMQAKECHLLDSALLDKKYAVAYFSAEYGLHRSLPLYAGGLGFLAGDFIKECSDLCVPLVAVGFMYPEGYFRQQIRDDGWQENLVEPINREAAPISKVINKDGQQLVVKVPLTDPPIHVAVWKVAVGRVPLYLMDTDIEINDPWNRGITARLYTGDLEQRLRQEIVLGIGGAEVLKALGIDHYLLHLNEGHAAFALLERIRTKVASGKDFKTAAKENITTTIFTTHTPVPAGHDIFPFQMIEKYFHSYWPDMGLDRDTFFQLGVHPEKPEAGFNMTAFALRLSGSRNAVSKRHAEVSQKMWHSLWPDVAENKVPIEYVTNGVHTPTWIEPKMKLLLDKHIGTDWLDRHDDPTIWQGIDKIPDIELLQTHHWLKVKLIDAIRERTRQRWGNGDASASIMLTGGAFLDPWALTIGFARRFATYKRALLIFQDLDRLKKLLKDRWRPIQIIFAGKAHPADDPGKRLLQNLINLARDPQLGGRIAFVEDYGEQLAQYLVHGVDIWLNNPLPPFEACGTSGMKAALNGVPHLSILDGWWGEGFNGKNGWGIEHDDNLSNPDGSDADKIYNILEQDIIPRYYNLSENGIPNEWIRLMKETIKSSAAGFSARRMVKQYIEKFYSKSMKGA
ncbi:alpha-glucan family phosphorylase [Desulfobacula phenolica]|uniref:glycogen phosphorylase n=1 Tax=Desulfobacula phenolica TaxID=90732 RepID=A0A1H2EGP4_9BACT|nr:alpha-glucan family phosphorylase [Desulfobacula phenolica]SDT94261.1 starch phosphorylase [Desulfobacula phenolica]